MRTSIVGVFDGIAWSASRGCSRRIIVERDDSVEPDPDPMVASTHRTSSESETPPANAGAVSYRAFLVSVAVVVTGVLVRVGGLVDHRGLGGAGFKPIPADTPT